MSKDHLLIHPGDLVGASSRGIRWDELVVLLRYEILIVTISEDRFEDVLALTHKIKIPDLEIPGLLFQPALASHLVGEPVLGSPL